MQSNKYCVIMAGGIGSRFWPISRNSLPKQFIDILGTGKTFIRSTFERFRTVVPVENFYVVTNTAYKELVLEQLPELSPQQVVCEPIGRNTAPCIAYAAFKIAARDPQSVMIVTPSDHHIPDSDAFVRVIDRSVDFAAARDTLMTIGLKPSHPNTGYGYIQVDDDPQTPSDICRVRTFTEKPNQELARAFVESGEFFWNSGIFIWKTEKILSELKIHLPEIYQSFDAIRTVYNTDAEEEAIRGVYPELRGISIDIGIMEKAENVHVYCGDFRWSDIGTWGSLYNFSHKDSQMNVTPSTTALFDTTGCIIKAPEDKLVVIEGLHDYIVVDTGDVLMICPKSGEQNIKKYIEEVKFSKGDKFI